MPALPLAFIRTESLEWVFLATLIHVASVLLVSYHCLRVRREPTSAILWIFLTWSFPIIGAVLFLSFGLYRLTDKGWEKHRADQQLLKAREAMEGDKTTGLITYWKTRRDRPVPPPENETAREIDRAMDAICPGFPLVGGNRIKLLVTGDEAYPAMLEAINAAEHHIHLQSFIISPDNVGKRFLDTLAHKANNGVTVRILFDRFGSTHAVWQGLFRCYRKIPNLHLQGWTQANFIKREFQINLRNHRKTLVVDGHTAFLGGINLSKENCSDNNKKPDQDYHFMVNGPLVHDIQYSFLRDWHFMTEENPDSLLDKKHFPTLNPCGHSAARLLTSGPTATEMETVADAFFSAVSAAEHTLVAVTPYFVPTLDILQAFRSAALRGVDVQLVMPWKNNHLYTGLASRSLYDELLRAGVKIYERPPPFMHAKAMLVDDAVAIVGTANLDVRSLKLNYETNLVIYDSQFVYDMRQACNFEIQNSRQIDLTQWAARPMHHRLTENFFALFTPIL
jgi:cardiolipin synthase